MSSKSTTVQGEGNYEAAKEYNKKAKDFVKNHNDEQSTNRHTNLSDSEKEEGNAAMDKAKSRGRS